MDVRKKNNIVKILIITYTMFAAGIGQRTYRIEAVVIIYCFVKEYVYEIKDRNLPNNSKKVKMIAVFIA